MQVSAINPNNSFKSNAIDPEVIDVPYSMNNPNEFDKLDRVDFRRVASVIDNNTDATKHTSPIRFFLVSTALAAASLVAFRAAAFSVLNKMDGKFPVYNLLEKGGKALNNGILYLSDKLPQSDAKNIKGFFINISKNALTKIAQYGKAGLSQEEVAKICQDNLANFYAKNAIKKGISNIAGVGAAGLTIASQYKDENDNGIPDKAEKVLGIAKEAMQIIPVVYSAMS